MRFLLIIFLTLVSFETGFAKAEVANTNQKEVFSIDQLESIMLDDDEMSKVNKALEFFGEGREYESETPQEDGESQISDMEKENIKLSKEMQLIEERSRVYLGSILYFNDKIWSIWINDKRITSISNNENEEIFIEQINGKKIDAIWTIGASKWKILMGEQTDSSVPKANELNQIKIKFSLHPNQTYLLRTNEIVEGKKFNRKSLIKTTVKQEDNELEKNELKQ